MFRFFSQLFPGSTLSDRLVAVQNRPSGFDYMRIILALAVVLWHVNDLVWGRMGEAWWQTALFPFAMLIVPMFFSLSGFLVAGSFERNKSLITFLGLRVFRIMPALVVEVLLSALILGPLLTTLPLGDYFSSPVFHAYFWNILGEIHYYLPGVFEQNPFTQVNGQLWTVPYELICYVVLAGFAVLGIYRKASWLWYALLLCYGLQVLNTILRPREDVISATGSTVVMSFIAGLLLYRYRTKISWSLTLCLVTAAVSLWLATIPAGQRFAPLPIAYMTVYLGLLNPPRNKLLLSGDYSYGIYLYGYPIQQALIAANPVFRVWYWHLLAVVPAISLFAAFSWWVIEKPVLGRKDVLKRLESWYMNNALVQQYRWLRFFSAISAMKSPEYD